MPDSRVPVLLLGVPRKLCLARTVILARPLGVASPSALAPKFEDDAWGRRPAFIFSCASSNVSAGYVLYCNHACLELDAEPAAAQPTYTCPVCRCNLSCDLRRCGRPLVQAFPRPLDITMTTLKALVRSSASSLSSALVSVESCRI